MQHLRFPLLLYILTRITTIFLLVQGFGGFELSSRLEPSVACLAIRLLVDYGSDVVAAPVPALVFVVVVRVLRMLPFPLSLMLYLIRQHWFIFSWLASSSTSSSLDSLLSSISPRELLHTRTCHKGALIFHFSGDKNFRVTTHLKISILLLKDVNMKFFSLLWSCCRGFGSSGRLTVWRGYLGGSRGSSGFAKVLIFQNQIRERRRWASSSCAFLEKAQKACSFIMCYCSSFITTLALYSTSCLELVVASAVSDIPLRYEPHSLCTQQKHQQGSQGKKILWTLLMNQTQLQN